MPKRLVGAAIACLVALACGDDSGTPPSGPSVRATIGPEGGTLALPDGTQAHFSAGSLGSATQITLRRMAFPLDGAAFEGTTRLGEEEVVLEVDPAHVEGRFDVTLVLPTSLQPPQTDAARLFLSEWGESDAHGAEDRRPAAYVPADTTSTVVGDAWRLQATCPPPSERQTRFSAWIADRPVTRFESSIAAGGTGGGAPAGAALVYSVFLDLGSPASDETRLVDRLRAAMDQSMTFFRGPGRADAYPFPAAQRPLHVSIGHATHADGSRPGPGGFCPGSDEFCTLDAGFHVPHNGIWLNATKLIAEMGPTPPALPEMTAAHELYHALQVFAAGAATLAETRNQWVREGTASLMMDEAFDEYPAWFNCLKLTTASLDGSAGGCQARAYETGLFFRWLGAAAVDDVFRRAATGGGSDLAGMVLDQLTGSRRYFVFADDVLYRRTFDRTDGSADATGRIQTPSETAVGTGPHRGADVWSPCRFGDPFSRPNLDETCADEFQRRPTVSGGMDAFRLAEIYGSNPMTTGSVPIVQDVPHLAGYRWDLVNWTARSQRFLVYLPATGAADQLEARVYKRGESTPETMGCEAASLSAPMRCQYDDTSAASAEPRVLVVANNGRAGQDARVMGTWQVIPTDLEAVSGHSPVQEDMPGATLAQPFVVRALDLGAVPMGGARVRWTVTAGGGALSASEGVTEDAGGTTSVTLTLGPTAGDNAVQATLVGPDDEPLGMPLTIHARGGASMCAMASRCPTWCDPASGMAMPGYTCCGSNYCANLQMSDHDCGSCGHRCLTGQRCQFGECIYWDPLGRTGMCTDIHTPIPPSCPDAGQTPCPPDPGSQCYGYCAALATALTACGACGHECMQGELCCGSRCISPFDDANCGACGNACPMGQRCCSRDGSGQPMNGAVCR